MNERVFVTRIVHIFEKENVLSYFIFHFLYFLKTESLKKCENQAELLLFNQLGNHFVKQA